MDFVRLGRTGLKVSRLCLGCMTYGSSKWRPWVLDEEASLPFFQRAIEAGINFFDTADVYSQGESERVTGKALKAFAKRHEVVIATKVNGPMGADPNNRGLSRKHILDGIDRSLTRLGVDYVDLYQIHRFDPETPIEETLEALNDVVRAGKARYIGASSMYAWQFMKALSVAEQHHWTRFISMQDHYNLVYREEEREMIPLCHNEGIAVIPWSPIARGFLAGNRNASPHEGETTRARTDDYAHRMYYQQSDFDVLDRVTKLADAHGVKPAQVALAWMFHKPDVTAPIIGVSKLYQFEEALAALDIKLSGDEMNSLEECYTPHPIMGH